MEVTLVSHIYTQILFGRLPLPLKVANEHFIPQQVLSVRDEKCNIREISSTEEQSPAKGEIFTLKVCQEM